MYRKLIPVLAMLTVLLMGASAISQSVDPFDYVIDFEAQGLGYQEIIDELLVLHDEVLQIYEKTAYYGSASSVAQSQAELIELEEVTADFEGRSTALFLHAMRLRCWDWSGPGTPFELSVEVRILRIKTLYIEIIARCHEIEYCLTQIIIK